MRNAATVHASAVLLGESGVLVRGASGSGKSALCLALIAADAGNRLVADDRVALRAVNGRVLAYVPPALAGLLEIRGIGIVNRPHVSPVRLDLVVDLLPPADCPRLPAAGEATTIVEGIALPRLVLPAGCSDALPRIAAALRRPVPVEARIS